MHGKTQSKLLHYYNEVQNRDGLINESYYAYLLIQDANNAKERNELLPTIVKNPYYSYLFIKNFNPTDKELNYALESIKKDIKCSHLFMINCNPNEEQIKELFEIVLNDSNYAFLTVKFCKLSYEYKKMFYDKYNDFYLNEFKADDFYIYCLLLRDLITDKDKETLIQKIYDEQNATLAKSLLEKNHLNLSEELIDILESIFIIKNLTEKED